MMVLLTLSGDVTGHILSAPKPPNTRKHLKPSNFAKGMGKILRTIAVPANGLEEAMKPFVDPLARTIKRNAPTEVLREIKLEEDEFENDRKSYHYSSQPSMTSKRASSLYVYTSKFAGKTEKGAVPKGGSRPLTSSLGTQLELLSNNDAPSSSSSSPGSSPMYSSPPSSQGDRLRHQATDINDPEIKAGSLRPLSWSNIALDHASSQNYLVYAILLLVEDHLPAFLVTILSTTLFLGIRVDVALAGISAIVTFVASFLHLIREDKLLMMKMRELMREEDKRKPIQTAPTVASDGDEDLQEVMEGGS